MLRNITRQSSQHIKRLSKSITTRAISKPSLIFPVLKVNPINHSRSFHSTPFYNEQYTITKLTTERYHKLADDVLEHMVSKLEEIGDETDLPGFDIEYSQGVMTISLGEHGTYVINKQPPNHQIWLSSPVSGPQRYDFDEKHHKWFYHRDNHTLESILNTELSQAFKEDIDLLEGYEPENH